MKKMKTDPREEKKMKMIDREKRNVRKAQKSNIYFSPRETHIERKLVKLKKIKIDAQKKK